MLSNVKKKDVPLIAISLAAIVFIAATLSLFPQQTAQAADSIFNGVTRLLGSTVQVLVLLALGLVLYLATSKYGNIRLGEGKVEYSTLSWLFMFICAGLGSSTLYWGVAEWAYYYQTPGLNIAPQSPKALEYSIPYSFFHWGVSAWATYTLASLIMAYHFHVRKNKGLSLSGIVSAITGVNPQGFWGRLVDLMFLIATVGALTISLVVTAATFTRGLSALTGLPDNFTMQAFVILLSGGIFCMSSWIGINNGLQRLSKMVGWGAFLLPLVVLLVGPTEFITNNIINAVGLTTQNFLQMSLFTDPLGDGAFTRNLREGDDPDRGMRLFWCVVITLIPLSILFTGASLETMKTTVVLTALPFLAILLIKTGGFVRWLKQDYAHVPVHQIETHTPEPIIKAETLPVGAVLKGDGQSL
ncbi:TPA: BCCT family transporter [Klebsiella pneumoniae]